MADFTSLENTLKGLQADISQNSNTMQGIINGIGMNTGDISVFLDLIAEKVEEISRADVFKSTGGPKGKSSGTTKLLGKNESKAIIDSSKILSGISNSVSVISSDIKDIKNDITTGFGNVVNAINNIKSAAASGGGTFGAVTIDGIDDIKNELSNLSKTLNKDAKEKASEKFDEEQEMKRLKRDYYSGKEGRKRIKEEAKADARRERLQEKYRKRYNSRQGGSFVSDQIFKLNSSIKTIATGNIKSSDVIDKGISKISSAGIVGGIVGSVLSVIKTAFDIYTKQEKDAQAYVRSYGGGRYGMREYQVRAANFVNRSDSLWDTLEGRLQYTFEDFNKGMQLFSDATGRAAARKSDTDMRSAADLARWGVSPEAVKSFDTFGKSIESTDKFMASMYGRTGKIGLSFKAVSAAVNNNLKMAQTHTFANGLRGLTRMAEKSVELKYNMNSIAAAADKVSTLEGAMKTGAQLSVLGGQFAAYGNPLQLMYEGLNDTESLNDRIIEMFGNSAYFDINKGQIDMNPIQRQILKTASEAMGVGYEDALNIAFNNRRMEMVEVQAGTRGLDNDTIEYLKNIAEIDDKGRAYISDANGRKTYVSNMTGNDAEMIKRESQAKDIQDGEKLGGIWAETMSLSDKFDQFFTYLQQKLGVWVAKAAFSMFETAKKVAYGFSRVISGINKFINRFKRKGERDEINDYDLFEKKSRIGTNSSFDDNFLPEDMLPPVVTNGAERNDKATSVRESYFVSNAKPSNANQLNVSPVYPSNSYSAGPGAQRISFEPIKVEIGGNITLDMPSGKQYSFDVNNLTNEQVKEIGEKVSTIVYKDVMTKLQQGYNKERYPLVGTRP